MRRRGTTPTNACGGAPIGFCHVSVLQPGTGDEIVASEAQRADRPLGPVADRQPKNRHIDHLDGAAELDQVMMGPTTEG
jgi:hypothetical protein